MIKHYLPKTLFGRSLMIIIMPLVLLQLVMVVIFYERHWESMTRQLVNNLAGDIALLVDVIHRVPESSKIRQIAKSQLDLDTKFLPKGSLPPAKEKTFPLEDRLTYALKQKIDYPLIVDIEPHKWTQVTVQMPSGVLHIHASRKRLYSPTTYIFVLWMIGSSLILVSVSVIFMRNQIRPIKQLADAADRFGKGQDVAVFKPSGAIEVRQAANAFNKMKRRIQRQISQRTEMLAGVSHDLRTPLTRMNLQADLMKDKKAAKGLKTDLDEMKRMIDGYLAFARGEGEETSVEVNFLEFLNDIVRQFKKAGKEIDFAADFDQPVVLMLRKTGMTRCLNNLISNAFQHGETVRMRLSQQKDMISVVIDDDGPGIPEELREDVFKPFYRLEASRNSKTGGMGLGLSLARDFARVHGGDIWLSENDMGGLRATVSIPI